MNAVPKWVLVCLLGLMGQSLLIPSAFADPPYLINLKNGNTIKTTGYSEEGGMIYYEKYGTRIGIKKSAVVDIKQMAEDRPSADIRTNDYLGYQPPPKYFEVSGAPIKSYNGIYEQSSDHNGKPLYAHITQEHHLFYHIKGWALGRLYPHGASISYVNSVHSSQSPPVTGCKWTTSTGKQELPSIKITPAQAPNSVYQGAQAYVVKNFPFVEANGVYKPLRIHLGKMRYKHISNSFEMYYQPKWGWCISNCTQKCNIAYRSRADISRQTLPHDVRVWYDAHRRELSGSVTLKQ